MFRVFRGKIIMTRKKIGLALSGGGARGFAHIGVLKVLVENEIPIDFIAGTSAGSIVGGAYAAGMSVREILAMAMEARWSNLTRPSFSTMGVLSSVPMGSFLSRHFPAVRIENCRIPFAAAACDLATSKEVILKDSGDLIAAIRASCAVPGVFTPVSDADGRLLIDGGVISPMPVDVVRSMGADVLIAIDLIGSGSTFRSVPRTALGVLFQSAMMLQAAAGRFQKMNADLVITPPIGHLRPDEIKKRDEFLALGEEEARNKIQEVKRLL